MRSLIIRLLVLSGLMFPAFASVAAGWSAAGNLKTSRNVHTSTLLPNGKVLVTGGFSGDTSGDFLSTTSSAELYDLAANAWTSAGNLATARASTATLLPNGKVLVAGGTDATNFTSVFGSVELYNPSANSWTAARNLASARCLPYCHNAIQWQSFSRSRR